MHRLKILLLAAAAGLALVLALAVLPGYLTAPGSLADPGAGDTRDDFLSWQEFPIDGGPGGGTLPGDLAARGLPVWDGQDRSRQGETTNRGHRLRIGSDLYETTEYPLPFGMTSLYILRKNGRPQQALFGRFTAYSPDRGVQNIGGAAVWEFAGGEEVGPFGGPTVVVDGADVRRAYGLDAAYAPYSLGGKLLFIGEKAGKRFVVYDGRRYGPQFDQILIAYCCEPAAYTAHGGGGRYVFWGERGGRQRVVEIAQHP